MRARDPGGLRGLRGRPVAGARRDRRAGRTGTARLSRRAIAGWTALGAASAAAALAVGALGLPSPSLFAALLVGLAYALSGRAPLQVPPRVTLVSLALVGVAMGAYFDGDTLAAIGERWAGVLVISVATLGLSVLAGLGLAAAARLDRPTALLGLVAGGASGIIGMSDELGADARLVAFMQYLRVLVVVLVAPLVVALFLGGGDARAPVAAGSAGIGADLLYTVAACAIGLALVRLVPVPAGSVLLPMVVAAALAGSGLAGDAGVPDLVQDVAFAVVGLQVGLRFTPAAVRQARRLLPAVLALIAALIAACAGLAVLLTAMTGVSYADAYLATTPGGLYAVLATALDGGGDDPAFVLAVQALRLLVMVLAAPAVVRLLVPSA